MLVSVMGLALASALASLGSESVVWRWVGCGRRCRGGRGVAVGVGVGRWNRDRDRPRHRLLHGLWQ